MKIKIIIVLALLLFSANFAEAASRRSVAVSPDKSTIFPKNQVVNSYEEKAMIGVQLLNELGDPVKGHRVKLIASSEKVSIQAVSAITDVSGKALFEVNSVEPGVVSYAAYDLDGEVILRERAKVVSFDSISLARGAPAGEVARLKFDEVDEVVKPNEGVTFTLTAEDEAGQTVVDYIGEVSFSVEGDDGDFVDLPEDYTFKVSDQGSHTFGLALTFQKSGLYEIDVADTAHFEIEGKYVFDVKAASAAAGAGITLSNPVAGTYGSNTLVISGQAKPGDRLKVIDNEFEIGSTAADAAGNFSYTTAALEDGAHKIYVVSVSATGTVVAHSSTVDIVIDTAAPEISRVELDPSEPVNPNDSVAVKLFVNEQLGGAQVKLEDNLYDLVKTAQGYYAGTITAPVPFGEYKLDFILTDNLGNKSTVEDQAVLKVGIFGLSPKNVPGDVPNLTAVVGNGRVSLNWSAPAPGANPIVNYRVFYGLSATRMINAVDTFTNATSWYVPGLANGTEYFFGVAAIDSLGTASEHFLTVVSAVPSGAVSNVQSPAVTHGVAGNDALGGMKSDVSNSGPEIGWLVVLSLLGGIFYGRMRTWIRFR